MTDRNINVGVRMLLRAFAGRPMRISLLNGSTVLGSGISYFNVEEIGQEAIAAVLQPINKNNTPHTKLQIGTDSSMTHIRITDLTTNTDMPLIPYSLTVTNPTIVTIGLIQIELEQFRGQMQYA